jgi:hypothetical protein
MTNLKELQKQYKELFGKDPAAAFKNKPEWLMSKIDEALEKGVDPVEPKKGKEVAPVFVVGVAEEIHGAGHIGKFYTGDQKGGNWEISIDNTGISYKKLS